MKKASRDWSEIRARVDPEVLLVSLIAPLPPRATGIYTRAASYERMTHTYRRTVDVSQGQAPVAATRREQPPGVRLCCALRTGRDDA